MNYAMLKDAVATFNRELDEMMVFEAVRQSPKLLYSMMSRAREAGRAELAEAIQAALDADDGRAAAATLKFQTPNPKPQDPAREDSRPTTPRTCIYLVKEDARSEQVECGQPATHRAADNRKLLYCKRHADFVAMRFQVVELPRPNQQRQPRISQHILP